MNITEKEKIRERETKLIELTSEFCRKKLNDEYSILCEKLIKKLGRKRNVPFARGRLEIWAAGVVLALGYVNFLFDKSFEPYVSLDEINYFLVLKNSLLLIKRERDLQYAKD